MARNKEWERIEPYLYRRKYQTPQGEWTTRYFVRFQDWKGVNRKFAVGTDLRAARRKLQTLLESVLKIGRISLGDGNTTPTRLPN
jgi:hypothetical protein